MWNGSKDFLRPVWLCVVIGWCVCGAQSNQEVFTLSPGTVSALVGGPLTLEWQISVPSEDVFWCRWQYTKCPTCGVDQFIGYNNKEKKILDISLGNKGWNFINQDSPCLGGIYRLNTMTEMGRTYGHDGLYKLIVELNDSTEYQSEYARVVLYNESDLAMTVGFGGEERTIPLLEKNIVLEKKVGEQDVPYRFGVRLNNFPSSAVVNITKYSGGRKDVHIPRCNARDDVCHMDFTLGLEKDVVVLAEIDTGIQHQPVVTVKLPFEYDAIPVTPPSRAPAVTFAVLFALLFVLLLVYFILLCVCWRGKKTPNDIKDVMTLNENKLLHGND